MQSMQERIQERLEDFFYDMKIQWRYIVFVQLFMACFVCYMLRMNVNVAIVAMTLRKPARGGDGCISKPEGKQAILYRHEDEELTFKSRESVHPDNAEEIVGALDEDHQKDIIYVEKYIKLNPNYGVRYIWSQPIIGMILGSYYWGLFFGSALGGMATEYFSIVHVVGVSTAISIVASLLVPLGATVHWSIVVICRVIIGFFSGFALPGVQAFIAIWSPPSERNFFVSSIMGCTMGTIVTSALCGVIITKINWPASFYITGTIGVIWTVTWYLFVSKSPENHMFISEEERTMIMEACASSKKEKLKPPLKEILTNVPFWALVYLQFGSLWGFLTTMTLTPKFMSEILGYNIKNSGFISALPHLMRFTFGILFGFLGDYFKKRACMSNSALVKTLTIVSHIIPSILLLSIVFAGCNHNIIIFLLVTSLGFNGSCVCTTLKNPQDIGPRFAGTIYGIMGCIGACSGILSPQINALLTKDKNTMGQWHYNFIIGAAIYSSSAILFMIFGSGETQEFNDIIIKRE